MRQVRELLVWLWDLPVTSVCRLVLGAGWAQVTGVGLDELGDENGRAGFVEARSGDGVLVAMDGGGCIDGDVDGWLCLIVSVFRFVVGVEVGGVACAVVVQAILFVLSWIGIGKKSRGGGQVPGSSTGDACARCVCWWRHVNLGVVVMEGVDIVGVVAKDSAGSGRRKGMVDGGDRRGVYSWTMGNDGILQRQITKSWWVRMTGGAEVRCWSAHIAMRLAMGIS